MNVSVLDEVCKYKVGDVLTLAIEELLPTKQRTILKAVERIIQQCEGGVQVTYLCRVHTLRESQRWAEKQPMPVFVMAEQVGGYERIKESELAPLDLVKYAEMFKKSEAEETLDSLAKMAKPE